MNTKNLNPGSQNSVYRGMSVSSSYNTTRNGISDGVKAIRILQDGMSRPLQLPTKLGLVNYGNLFGNEGYNFSDIDLVEGKPVVYERHWTDGRTDYVSGPLLPMYLDMILKKLGMERTKEIIDLYEFGAELFMRLSEDLSTYGWKVMEVLRDGTSEIVSEEEEHDPLFIEHAKIHMPVLDDEPSSDPSDVDYTSCAPDGSALREPFAMYMEDRPSSYGYVRGKNSIRVRNTPALDGEDQLGIIRKVPEFKPKPRTVYFADTLNGKSSI